MTSERQRVAILGGTFDPVHNGHLALLLGARDALNAVEGWLLPAGRPNLREQATASAADRRDMLAAAIAGTPGLLVMDIELRRRGHSFTVDTDEALRAQHPELDLWWILGADAVRRIREWHRMEDLLARARFAIVQRAGTPPIDVAELHALGLHPRRTRLLPLTPPHVGATQVRARLAAGASIEELVPAPVAALIADRGLYGTAAGAHNAAG